MDSIPPGDDWKTTRDGPPWNTPVQLLLANGKLATGLFRSRSLEFEDLDGNAIKPLVLYWKALKD